MALPVITTSYFSCGNILSIAGFSDLLMASISGVVTFAICTEIRVLRISLSTYCVTMPGSSPPLVSGIYFMMKPNSLLLGTLNWLRSPLKNPCRANFTTSAMLSGRLKLG